ncbi:hypothetical protein QE250_12795 [Chromatiaceae bacterium AAb-1]|nr:hypothetical protein [Chromatiaceae bacterium AAb-1]
MEKDKAFSIVDALANGINPVTGECFPEDSPYNHPDIIRALFSVLREQQTVKKPKKSLEEKQQENLAKGLPMNYGLPWTDENIDLVIKQFALNVPIDVIANQIARKPGSIIGLLKKKEIITEEQAFSMGLRHRNDGA